MKGPHGESIFRYASLGYRNYTGFFFPNPDLLPADAWLAGPGSRLDPHLYIQNVPTAAAAYSGPVVKSPSVNAVTARPGLLSQFFRRPPPDTVPDTTHSLTP